MVKNNSNSFEKQYYNALHYTLHYIKLIKRTFTVEHNFPAATQVTMCRSRNVLHTLPYFRMISDPFGHRDFVPGTGSSKSQWPTINSMSYINISDILNRTPSLSTSYKQRLVEVVVVKFGISTQ